MAYRRFLDQGWNPASEVKVPNPKPLDYQGTLCEVPPLFFFFLVHTAQQACGILVPIEDRTPTTPASEAQSLDYWTTKHQHF